MKKVRRSKKIYEQGIIVASGTEVELALKVQEKLKENNIHSKVEPMPCMSFLICSLRTIVTIL